MSDVILWGFDGSTYVRTIKMVLAEKNFTEFEQVQINVLEGEPKRPEHLVRHPSDDELFVPGNLARAAPAGT